MLFVSRYSAVFLLIPRPWDHNVAADAATSAGQCLGPATTSAMLATTSPKWPRHDRKTRTRSVVSLEQRVRGQSQHDRQSSFAVGEAHVRKSTCVLNLTAGDRLVIGP